MLAVRGEKTLAAGPAPRGGAVRCHQDGLAPADEPKARVPQQLALQAQVLLDAVGECADVAVASGAVDGAVHADLVMHSPCQQSRRVPET